jgi:DNA modification methylase
MMIEQEITERYAIYNCDCIQGLSQLPNESIGLSVYSPPFGGLYVYSSSELDLSNCRSYEEFFAHYEFVVSEIARVTMPGRISAVHCMDVPKDGANVCAYRDFPGDIIRLHEKHGLEYLPRISIWKEPLAVRNRTMAKALAHCTIVEDSTLTNCASADYLIPFRKKGKNPRPVAHPFGLLEYAGARQMPAELIQFRGFEGDQTRNRFSHWIWRQYASSIWDDIRGNLGHADDPAHEAVLPFEQARDDQDEKHIHPLQLDVIERAITLWSNRDDVVLTPFMGVGSEVYGAVTLGRKAVGFELKASYFRQAKQNLSAATLKRSLPELSLFDRTSCDGSTGPVESFSK